MECPHCHQEITGKSCAACGAEGPTSAHYCMQCGALLGEVSVNPSAADQDEGLDLENRVLCPDGNCTGIIVNGKCSECGRPYQGQSQ